jgi:hypothetical protein
VASAITKGTLSSRARVWASSVLPRAGRADQQDVALGELDIVLGLALVSQALVVVVDRDRQDLLGVVLADHVLVEDRCDLVRRGQLGRAAWRCGLGLASRRG